MMRIVNFRTTISLLILISAIFFLSDIRVESQPPIQPPGLDIAMDVQEAHTSGLMADPDVVGTAVGLSEDGEPVIKVFTNTGRARGIPGNIEGIPVEVEITGPFIARSDPSAWFPRPVPIGVSTGHPDITAGTIGCRVTDGAYVYALSNNHVYANSNNASIGDSALQPGPYDGGDDPADKIGELFDFEPIKFDGSDNYYDAAIAKTSAGNLGAATPGDGYGIPNTSIYVTPPINLKVKKFGRTTKLTKGYIDAINASVNVCYQCGGIFCFKCNKLAKFVGQIVIKPGDFSAGGDSGSLIVTDDPDNKPVGLLFAGSSSQTIANRIDLVLDRFGVDVDDGAGGQCANDDECDDGNACNGDETCVGGSCQAGTPVSCDDDDACTTDSCDPATGTCSNDPITCNDGNACTNDSCDPVTGCVFEDNGTCTSSCFPVGTGCTANADCCSNKCTGKPGSKTCK